MAKTKRWREVKKSPSSKQPDLPKGIFGGMPLKAKLQSIYATERIKAFITDMFMINMPILYLTTYIFLDGKDAFTQNQSAILACGLCYGIIIALFLAFSAQTPGYRYMRIKLLKDDEQKVGFIRAFVRYLLWIVGTTFLFGLVMGILRRDGKCFHDWLCSTQIFPVLESDKSSKS
ncbi:RDD family protein [Helicobacter sp. MIT 05-5293]|uniref:RDD family protein n=1 Tax=Helicobacter sp. MIT 05-5293 TaxID=1548149 RepID=UPI0009DF22B3|nr:RDD family protein [Helicobacter sp. MIT 05-5293]TLD82066.1 RDD family protein [Helicobacter sp. MIT 05-5293]